MGRLVYPLSHALPLLSERKTSINSSDSSFVVEACFLSNRVVAMVYTVQTAQFEAQWMNSSWDIMNYNVTLQHESIAEALRGVFATMHVPALSWDAFEDALVKRTPLHLALWPN
eukprot:TRINITY_DN80316_c0_g1_i1.p1 TRINITY_DN80316_c0_g1~~TRINITY_DN80316_c0_g1_i1.p1  ORF type:complete len:114 (+),score=10.26 TRINITY_DN80316_c0_g1_i1:58-399(+)